MVQIMSNATHLLVTCLFSYKYTIKHFYNFYSFTLFSKQTIKINSDNCLIKDGQGQTSTMQLFYDKNVASGKDGRGEGWSVP